MNKYIFLLAVPLMLLWGCIDDTSEYLQQEKENISVDQIDQDNTTTETPEGSLTPGLNQVKMNVSYEGVESERRFKYFMPVSVNSNLPISLIFVFHGAYGTGLDPIRDVTVNHPFNQLAIKNNCIVVFPAGEDTGEEVNWANGDYNIAFVDSMVNYFESHTPAVDPDRIYTCGHSSGAIFSYNLAYYRSEVIAAATPVSGQMKLTSVTETPTRAVPIRAFNGFEDDRVQYSAAVSNITNWASVVGGYFESDVVVSDTLEIPNYREYITSKWNGGAMDLELYGIIDEGHGISWHNIAPMMWEFMKSHPKGALSKTLYLATDLKSFEAYSGQTVTIQVKYTEGAVVSLVSPPDDWTVDLTDGVLTVKAPDFFGANTINRNGQITIRAEYDGSTKTVNIPFKLIPPKSYYEVGDIEFDDNYNPIGVVVWVNPAKINEAKIMALDETRLSFFGISLKTETYGTPDMDNGLANTLDLINYFTTLYPLTSEMSAFVYASEYRASAGTTDGWYLPALNELQSLQENYTFLNEAIERVGGMPLVEKNEYGASADYLSSTCDASYFYSYSFDLQSGKSISRSKKGNSGFSQVRAFKVITK